MRIPQIASILRWFVLEDHEYIKVTLFRFPFTVWLTVYEPRYRYTLLRRFMPWRLRIQLAGIVQKWNYSCCTRCAARFSMKELLDRKSDRLQYFQSGSICHRDCEPTSEFKEMVAQLRSDYSRLL